MSAPPRDDRLKDLLAERAAVGLGDEQAGELNAMLRRNCEAFEMEFDCAAAALHLGMGLQDEPMPESLRRRVERDALAALRERDHNAQPTPIERAADDPPAQPDAGAIPIRAPGRAALAPWLAAAAAIALALIGWLRPLSAPSSPPLEQQLAALRAAPETIRLEWTALDDPAARGAAGEVVWNSEQQRGFMRFAGLAPNDPGEQQYQLWIFDATRSKARPVDGGVFDIPASGEAVVPINAKLPVGQAAAFAVTVERPGGVVVSDRSRLALLASRG